MSNTIVKITIATSLLGTSLGLLFPVTPFFAQELGANIDTVALLFSIYSLCAMVSAPFWGHIADKVGRKTVLLLGASAAACSYLWMANAAALWELFAARSLAGVFAGWMAASQALLSDLSDESKRVGRLGMLGAAFGIGITVGPASSSLLIQFVGLSFFHIYLLSSSLCMAATILTLTVKETAPVSSPRIRTKRDTIALFVQNRLLLTLLVLALMLSTGFSIVEGIFALWTKNVFALTPVDVGYLLTAAGSIAAILQGGLVGVLARKIGNSRTIAVAIVIMSIGAFFLIIANHLFLAVTGLFFLSAGFALFGPPLQTCLIEQNPEQKATLLGINHGTASLARVIGPAIGGLTFVYIGAYAPFVMSAILAAIAFILWFQKIRSFEPSAASSNQDAS